MKYCSYAVTYIMTLYNSNWSNSWQCNCGMVWFVA